MNPLNFLPARVVVPTSSPDTAGGGNQGSSFASALAEVANIAKDFAAEKVGIANQMRRIVASGDNSQMPQVYTRIIDSNARQDVLATVLTKTTSGVDQLVKMQ